MPPRINIGFEIDPGAKRRQREQEEREQVFKREREWDQAVKENPDLAPDFSAYNQGKAEYVRTGQFPTSRPQEVRTNLGLVEDVPNPGGGVPISVLPTTEVSMQDVPIKRGSPSYTFNQRTGRYEEAQSIPRGAEVRQFTPPAQSYAIGYDDSGRVVTQEPIEGDRDVSFRVGTLAARGAGRGGRGGLSPKEQTWKLTYDKAIRALMPRYDIMGKPIPPEIDPALLQAGVEAGQGLGVDTTFLEEFLAAAQSPENPFPAKAEPPRPGMGSKVKDFLTGGPKAGAPKADTSPAEALPGAAGQFEADLEKARLAVSRGLVTREEADRRLKKKYNRGM